MIIKECLIFICLSLTVAATRGPIGYQLFRNIDAVSQLRTGVQTKQFSSFDRKGGNDDGGPFACLRLEKGHCVIAECVGAGEIDSIWMTRDYGIFNKTGKIVVELDGITVIDNQLQAVLDGRTGPPFVWPLVGNGDDTSGGGVIKIPMTFKHWMKVTVDTNPNYYHITYRMFSDPTGVETFNPLDTAEDVIKTFRGFGVRDPKPIKESTKTFSKVIKNLNSAKSVTLFEQTAKSGEIREIRLQLPQLVRSPRNIDDGRAFGKQGSSSFYANIDPLNSGIRIIRRLDPNIVNQIAAIFVDGSRVGFWNSSKIGGKNNWAEEQITIDPKLTLHKSQVNIKQEFISSSFDFNEFCYEIDSLIGDQWIRTDVIDVGPDHPGEESAHRYQIIGQTFSGKRVFRFAIDPKKLQNSDQFLDKTRIRATFDGKVTIDAPIGQFFGSGLGMYDTRTLWFGIDARNAMFHTFWPMPFANEAKIEMIFEIQSDIANDIKIQVRYDLDQNIKTQLEPSKIGYFHATHRKENTRPGHDYVFLNTTGRGTFYGVTHTMKGLIKTGNLRDYLEGDERVFIDGKNTPEIYGTGTEDFYESAWYFRDGTTFNMPLNGNSGYETNSDDCLYDCTQAVRIYSGGIAFESSILFGIEHGPVDDNEPAIYSSVAYWYGLSDPALKLTDLVTVTEKMSREKHEYLAEGELNYQISSSYEGENYKLIKSSLATSASKEIRFKVSIDNNNRGVRIFRTSDQNVSNQCTDVFVNNKLIGRWLQPLGNQWSRFLDDSFDIPSNFTKSLTEIKIKLVVVSHNSGPLLWSAIHYKIFSVI